MPDALLHICRAAQETSPQTIFALTHVGALHQANIKISQGRDSEIMEEGSSPSKAPRASLYLPELTAAIHADRSGAPFPNARSVTAPSKQR